MIRLSGYLLVSGPKVSPSKARAELKVKIKNGKEVGDFCAPKGTNYTYGSFFYIVGKWIFDTDHTNWKKLRRVVKWGKKRPGTEVCLYLNFVYKDQCNMEFDAKVMNNIGKLGIPFAITCFKESK